MNGIGDVEVWALLLDVEVLFDADVALAGIAEDRDHVLAGTEFRRDSRFVETATHIRSLLFGRADPLAAAEPAAVSAR